MGRYYQEFVANLEVANLRHDKIGDREYVVVPMVMMTEGVHNGSQGAVFYSGEEFSKNPHTWNHKPVVVYHPTTNTTACDPGVLDKQQVGIILNAVWDGRLRAEAWLEKSRMSVVDERVENALEKGEMMEVSTGLFSNLVPEQGVWNEETYEKVAMDFHADHLAILPDKKGACSIEDGAGLLRNEASFDQTRENLWRALRNDESNRYVYIVDLFKDYVVFEEGGKLWRQQYSVTDTAAELMNEPSEVVRFVQYRSPDGSVMYNEEGKGADMKDKAMLIGAILALNTVFVESDKSFLEGKTVEELETIHNSLKPQDPQDDQQDADDNEEPVQNAAAPKQVTTQEYLANAPGELRSVLQSSLARYARDKQDCITKILNSERNQFSKAQLAGKDLDELEMIANLAVVPEQKSNDPLHMFAAGGFVGSAPVENQEAPLELPKLEFGA